MDFDDLIMKMEYGVATQADVTVEITVNSTKSTQSSRIGGIAGAVTTTGISDVYFRGKLVVNDVARVGGIVGDAENGVSVIRSANLGAMKISSESSSTLGQIGGVLGYGANGVLVKSTYNSANVAASGAYSINVGGIVGYSDLGVMIEDTYNRGSVSGQNFVGGIVGFSNTRSLEISSTYNTGRTSARLTAQPKVDVMVADGWEESAVARTNTFDLQTTGASRSVTGVVGKSTKNMKSQSQFEYLGWSIGTASSLWAIDAGTNDGYPYIKPVAAVSIASSTTRDLYGPVSFKQGSSKLTTASKQKLLSFVSALKAGGYNYVTVKSYTTSANTKLAGKRNDAVVKFLKSQGVTVKFYKEAVTRTSAKKKNKIWLVALKKAKS
jgi:outer membrane protein OmpA-like peptidoglycan-associated protein